MRVKGLGTLCALSGLAAASMAHAPTKVTYDTRVVTKVIPRSVSYQISRTVRSGRTVIHKKGADGKVVTTYKVTFINGKPVDKRLEKTEKIDPVNDVVLVGKPSFSVSRGSFQRHKTMTMTATGYDTSQETIPGGNGRTRTGMLARYGVVAVDPRVIKLGTFVFVENYGFAIAADTGGAIKGMKIDLCFGSRREALNFGRRKVVVHVLK